MKIKHITLVMKVIYEEFPIEIKIDIENPNMDEIKEDAFFHIKGVIAEIERFQMPLRDYIEDVQKEKLVNEKKK